MKNSLSSFDILALGFMTFAFFLGAGNIIFPPLAGAMAGEHLLPATLGFLVTAVGLPLITLIAVAKAGGGIVDMAKNLPSKVATFFALAVFIVIGPSFATPRAALVAFEISVNPFLDNGGAMSLAIFSIVFFLIVGYLSLSTGKLLDMVGKIITPLLIILLAILSISVFISPLSGLSEAAPAYLDSPFTKGFLEGYNTMDTLGALVFGMLIINVIKSKGIEDKKVQYKYLTMAGCIAAIGLTFVYVSLFYLGATSHGSAASLSNGGEIIAVYVQALFNTPGLILLALVVALACLTTAVGLVSAMSDFLTKLKPTWNRKLLVIVNCALCALVTNVGLNELISLSIPVLYVIYPIAIALVALTLLDSFISNKKLSYRFVMSIALFFGLLDGIKASGINMQSFEFLPLFDQGMAWALPTVAAIIIAIFIFKDNTDKINQPA
ncbi:branched-chain amino acid transport system II carrier protein [Psychromonas sp. Urea-02u-13]|uniref:branched-chain amino acid transport system II carrier protein n=1 Tax=Psychromonas sp. Urea-02u-13 TaxID=2058326 RepID=UPI000C338B5B|nr:branched-chain amino acid transport system II carrier protein [Psychromonas sp. Urea-02u-13]PKG38246.1 branched-chain amino acid transport system II carrier protein [Psychromonas sp. Urea-02u-13]